MRIEFTNRAVKKISWVPGNVNLADTLEKVLQITELVNLSLFTGRTSVRMEMVPKSKRSEKKLLKGDEYCHFTLSHIRYSYDVNLCSLKYSHVMNYMELVTVYKRYSAYK